MSVNLHDIVRTPVTYLHPDVEAVLYRGAGQINTPDGTVKAVWMQGVPVRVQLQSDKALDLAHEGRVQSEEVERKFYLYSETPRADRVAGVLRPFSRPGDIFRMTADDTWWLVTATLEDFAESGWASVRAVLQIREPDLSYTPEPL